MKATYGMTRAHRFRKRTGVTFVAFQDGKPVGLPQPIVTGFHSNDERQLYGAPVGLAVDKDGALLIADDVGDVVWRVTAADAR